MLQNLKKKSIKNLILFFIKCSQGFQIILSNLTTSFATLTQKKRMQMHPKYPTITNQFIIFFNYRLPPHNDSVPNAASFDSTDN